MTAIIIRTTIDVCVRHTLQREGLASIDVDIVHAIDAAVAEYERGDEDEPRRFLALGPDRAGNMLEVIVLMFDDGAPTYWRPLPADQSLERHGRRKRRRVRRQRLDARSHPGIVLQPSAYTTVYASLELLIPHFLLSHCRISVSQM